MVTNQKILNDLLLFALVLVSESQLTDPSSGGYHQVLDNNLNIFPIDSSSIIKEISLKKNLLIEQHFTFVDDSPEISDFIDAQVIPNHESEDHPSLPTLPMENGDKPNETIDEEEGMFNTDQDELLIGDQLEMEDDESNDELDDETSVQNESETSDINLESQVNPNFPSNLSSIYSLNEDCPISKSPTVYTKWATIEGFSKQVLGRCVDHFLGIPFAEPPVGKLRYAFPVPLKDKFPGATFSAKAFGSPCKQTVGSPVTIQPSSEDCLYLNVYRPSNCSPKNMRPVFVYAHGSIYTAGSASQPVYYGGYLTSITGILVVTFNYRLGAFGFLAGGGSKIPGNQAYFDNVLVLTWIKEYIKNFGGDPDRITFAGHSSSGLFPTMCLFDKECSKLADNFMILSPAFNSANYLDPVELAVKKSKAFSELVGCGSFSTSPYYLSPGEIDCLIKQDANIIAQQSTAIPVYDGNGVCALPFLLPFYGNEIFPDSFEMMMYRNEIPKQKSIFFGKVSTEPVAAVFLTPLLATKTEASLFMAKSFLPLLRDKSSKNLAEILSHYLSEAQEGNAYSIGKAVSSGLVDYCYHCVEWKLAASFAKFNRVFHYLYTYVAVPELLLPINIYGPFHFADVAILFGQAYLLYELHTDYDRQVTLELMKIVADFVYGAEMKWSKWEVKKTKRGQKVYYPYVGVIRGKDDVNDVKLMEDVNICPRMDI